MASLNILPGALFLTTNFGINGRKFCKIDLTRLPCQREYKGLTRSPWAKAAGLPNNAG